jgi:Holliday junction resolvasome RuvABC endonuclease subunit
MKQKNLPRGLFDEPSFDEVKVNEPGIAPKVGILEPFDKVTFQPKNLLALDLATNTGFCTRSVSGSWNLAPRKNESAGMRLIKLKASLKDICQAENIGLIVFEGAVTYGKFPNHVGVELQGVLKLFCEENAIEYKSYMPTEIKKFATGKGNAKKDQMIKAAQEKFGLTTNDDNQADAVCLYYLAKQDLGI